MDLVDESVFSAYARPWLEPVSPERSTGVLATSDDRYIELVAAVAALRQDLLKPWPYAPSFRIAAVGKELLRARSKDLRVAAYVAYAELCLSPDGGFGRALALLAGLVERYGDAMFPTRAEERAAAVLWFVEQARARLAVGEVTVKPEVVALLGRFEAAVAQRPEFGGEAVAEVRALRSDVERAASTKPVESGTLLAEILDEANIGYDPSGYDMVKMYGAAPFLNSLREGLGDPRINKAAVDAEIAKIDAALTAQLNEVLHHPAFQRLEAAWRALRFLIDRIDFGENIRVELLPLSKEELRRDFARAPDVEHTALHRIVYDAVYRAADGEPYGLLVGDYEFTHSDDDLALLEGIAAVAARSHAPFVTGVAPSVFGLDTWERLSGIKDLRTRFEGPHYARWRALREREDARYLGLCLPRFLLRLPYGASTVPVKSFSFGEDGVDDHDSHLWGNAAVALATRVVGSFAKYRWCPNIIGLPGEIHPGDGVVEGLSVHQYDVAGERRTRLPAEDHLTERREYELSEEGFIGLTCHKGTGLTAFLSASSVRKPRYDSQNSVGRAAETSCRVDAQLPYLFASARFAHYVKVIARDAVHRGDGRAQIERSLHEWLNGHDASSDDPSRMPARRMWRRARILLPASDGHAARCLFELKLCPTWKYMGAPFELSLTGVLDLDVA